MKKKLVLGFMTVVLAFSLVACGNKPVSETAGENQTDRTEENTQSTVEGDSDNAEPANDATNDAPAEETPEAMSESLYEAFLDNDAKVYIGKQFIYGYYDYDNDKSIALLDSQKGYSLFEFIERVNECINFDYGNMELDDVQYAYIDCGKDGEPELALQVGLDGDTWGYITHYYVIKKTEGKLQLCSKLETVYRSEEYFKNKYGVIYSGGSIGAAIWSQGYDYINADGERVFLYSADNLYGLGKYYGGLGSVNDVVMKYADEIDDEWSLTEYHFDDSENYLYTVYPEGEPLIEKIFHEAGATLYSQKQMDEMILQDMSTKGLSKEIFESDEEIEWQTVTNDSIREILDYGVNPVYVSTTEEFVKAISNDTNIVLMPGTYNLTEYILEHEDEIPYDVPNGTKKPGVYFTGDALEPGFMIYGIDNLKIISKDEKDMAEIVSEPRYELVVAFDSCNNVKVNHIIMGHTPEKGTCGGDVIGFNSCDTANIHGCDIYGCGAYGTYIRDSMYINFTDTKIHDCSYGCVEIYDSSSASFDNCKFVDCEDSTMFYNYDSNLSFYSCEFKNLRGDMIWMGEAGYTHFGDCTFDAAALNSLNSYTGDGSLNIY